MMREVMLANAPELNWRLARQAPVNVGAASVSALGAGAVQAAASVSAVAYRKRRDMRSIVILRDGWLHLKDAIT